MVFCGSDAFRLIKHVVVCTLNFCGENKKKRYNVNACFLVAFGARIIAVTLSFIMSHK